MNPPKTKNQVAGTSSKLKAGAPELVDACICDQANPQDCPLHPLKKTELVERLKWLWRLNDEDLGYLVAYHQARLAAKLQGETYPKALGQKLARFRQSKRDD